MAADTFSSQAVDAYLLPLSHARKPDIEAIRSAILMADPQIVEGIKWNAPSFRCHGEDFATMKLHPANCLQLVLHTGARARKTAVSKERIADPLSLLKWVSGDRCVITFSELDQQILAALAAIVHDWISLAEPDITVP